MFVLLTLACDGDDDTEALTDSVINAEYDVTVQDQAGCEGVARAVTTPPMPVSIAWMEGPLQIAGPPDLLGFDFGEVALAGSVDDGLTVRFSGVKAISDTSVSEQVVEAEGQATEGGDLWTIEGDVIVDTEDGLDQPCTITASFTALEEAR